MDGWLDRWIEGRMNDYLATKAKVNTELPFVTNRKVGMPCSL